MVELRKALGIMVKRGERTRNHKTHSFYSHLWDFDQFYPMHNQTLQENRRIREALIPLSEQLKSASWAIPIDESFASQTIADLEKVREHASQFAQEVPVAFPENPEFSPEKAPGEGIKKARHDTRNRLSQLFHLVQLLTDSADHSLIAKPLQNFSSLLESCLAVLNSEPPPGTLNVDQEPGTPNPKIHPHPGVVLIADDNAENRNLLARLLEPVGHTLHFAKDGKEAIDHISKIAFDVVLLDIEMPVMNGFEVLESLHASGHLGQTPVIVVTGLQGEQDAVRCIEIGAEDFLSRPIRPALLMARINASLEKKRLREQVFEQHFTPELARELARNPDPMKMKARNEVVSLLFCDIRSFTSISERLGPEQTVDWLSDVMGEFSARIIDLGGVLVDYTGDELLAMWGAPNHQPNHARLACQAALAIMTSLGELNRKWTPEIGANTEVGIGINTGEALVGNIGTHRKFKYGPLGTSVNLASRAQGATKYLKTPLLVTGNTVAQIDHSFKTRRLCKVRVQNIHKPVDLYELAAADVGEEWDRQTKTYERALELFEGNQLRDSSAILGHVLLESQNDGPSLLLMLRVVNAIIQDLPQAEFSPIWTLPGK
jgi:adenylate cyclase